MTDHSQIRKLLSVLLCWLTASVCLNAQDSATIRGTIVDSASNLNLEGAQVRLVELDLRTTSDRSGRFAFRAIQPGDYSIVVQFPGIPTYTSTVSAAAGADINIRIEMGADDLIDIGVFVVAAGPTGSERALARQRAQQNIADIVSADALGNFPDKTLADAVRRLAGITIERGPGQGEARYVTVRGLNSDFNSVSLDGVPVTVSNFDGASRSVPLDVISTRTADSVEVTKTLKPSDNADSIGGLIRIRSRSAFDRDDRFVSAQVGGYYNRLISRYGDGFYLSAWGYDGSFGFSDFLNEDRTLGFSLSLSTRAVPFASQSVDTRGFTTVVNSRNHPMGEDLVGLLVPTGVVLQEFFDKVDNLGVNTVFDFRPTDNAEYQLVLNWSKRESRRGRQRQEIRFDRDFRFWDRSAPITVQGDTITEFTSENRVLRQVRDFYEDQNHYTARLATQHTAGNLQINSLFGFQRGQFDGDPDRDMAVLFRTGFGDNTYRLDDTDLFFPRFETERNRNNPAQFGINQIDLGTRFITDDEWIAGTDLKWDLDSGRTFIQLGGQYRFRSRDYVTVDRFYDEFTTRRMPTWWLDEAPDGGSPVFADYGTQRSVRNRYEYGFFIDPTRARQVVDHLLGTGQLAFTADGELDSINRSLAGSYKLQERIYSTYLMAQTVRGPITWMTGLRLEHTRLGVDTHSGTVNEDFIFTEAIPIRGENSYTNLFPHLHARWDASDDWILRAAYSTSLQRASYRQLNPSGRIDQFDLSVTRGSAQLKPTRSHNLDLMMDYYFSSVGRISAGVFYKKMYDNIYRLNFTQDGSEFDGGLAGVQYDISEFRNARGADVYGLELSFNTPLAFMPGFLSGLELFGNLTYIESDVDTGLPGRESIKTPLFGQVEFFYNLGIGYFRNGWNARVAYNWRDAYLAFGGIDEDPRLDRYVDSLGQLDISVSYDFRNGFSVYSEFINVLDAPDRSFLGDRSTRPVSNEYRDWAVYFGVRWSR